MSSDEEFMEVSEVFEGNPQDLNNGIYIAKRCLECFLNNEYKNAQRLSENSENMYISLSNSSVHAIQSFASFQLEHFNNALTLLKKSNEIANNLRRKDSKVFKGKNIELTEVQVHADLCYAESLLLIAIIKIIRDEKITTLMRSGIKMRECYKCYQWCWNFVENYPEEKKNANFRELECGVYFGYGLFNLLISTLSSRILSLLQFLGFDGNRALGLELLKRGCRMKKNLRSVLCSLTLLCYHFYVIQILDMETPENKEEGNLLLKTWFDQYENSAFFLFYAGRAAQIGFDLTKAKDYLYRSIESQSEWKNFHDICYWELMWCHTIEKDWWLSLKLAEKLSLTSNWSQVIYRYLKASFIYQFIDENHNTTNERVIGVISRYRAHMEHCLMEIPKFKQTIAGKSVPIEKFLIKKAKEYLVTKRLVLPGIEMMYVWGIFKLIPRDPDIFSNLISIVRGARHRTNSNDLSSVNRDLALINFLEGSLHSYVQNDFTNASRCFNLVIESNVTDSYMVPYAYFELASIHFKEGRMNECQDAINKIENFKSFDLHNRLMFRVGGLVHKMKSSQIASSQQEPSTSSSVNS